MKLYKDQLSTLETFSDFIRDYKQSLALNALFALREYEGVLPTDYEDYVVFFVDYDEQDKEVFAVSKIIDEWQPVEINARVRKFTEEKVYPYDSHAYIEID